MEQLFIFLFPLSFQNIDLLKTRYFHSTAKQTNKKTSEKNDRSVFEITIHKNPFYIKGFTY